MGIAHKTLSQKTTGPRAVAKDDDVVVAFSNAAYFRNLTKDLMKRAGINDLSIFEKNLAAYIMENGTTRHVARYNGRIDRDQDTINTNMWFGFGRLQKASLGINKEFCGNPLPGLNVHDYLDMPPSIRKPLMLLFNSASQFTRTWLKDSFVDTERNVGCAGILNNALGFPDAPSCFEYFDIVVTRNTILRKHCDEKNDHRQGYNICTVYSFYTDIERREVKVSIIMTTRTTVGSAIEKARSKK